jgi:histidine phosphotransferase ChpT
MNDQSLDLSALVASRLCHDLISPLGAISNGVELLGLSSDTAEARLVADSARSATARIRLFRIAFGHSAPGQSVPLNELRSILDDMSATGRIAYSWLGEKGCSRDQAKLCLLALLCAETELAYGGRITLLPGEATTVVTASSDRIRADPGPWDIFRETPANAGAGTAPSLVQFPVLLAESRRQGRLPQVERGETVLRITV